MDIIYETWEGNRYRRRHHLYHAISLSHDNQISSSSSHGTATTNHLILFFFLPLHSPALLIPPPPPPPPTHTPNDYLHRTAKMLLLLLSLFNCCRVIDWVSHFPATSPWHIILCVTMCVILASIWFVCEILPSNFQTEKILYAYKWIISIVTKCNEM